MKILKNKRADIGDMPLWLLRLIVVIIIIVVIQIVINLFILQNIDTRSAEAKILTNRILFSGTGIIYKDKELSRVYPGIIDLDKFYDAGIERSLGILHDNGYFALRITLSDLEGNKLNEAYAYKTWYDNWKPVADLNLEGKGGVDNFVEKRYVLIYDPADNKIKRAVAEISILLPR